MWGVSLTHPVLVSFIIWGVSLTQSVLFFSFFFFFLSGKFLLHIPCWLHFYLGSFSYTSHASLTKKYSGEYPLHIPCWLHFYMGSFSYTSRAGFNLISGLSLTHPMLVLKNILGSISYTSRAGFIFMRELSLTHPILFSFLSG